MVIITLESGKEVSLTGNSIIQEEALEIADSLLKKWGQVHVAAKAVMLYEVEPKSNMVFSECPHYRTLQEGLEFEGYSERR